MSQGKPTLLVTGGAGYIGCHAVQVLKQAGYKMLVLDHLIYGHRELVENALQAKLIVGNISDHRPGEPPILVSSGEKARKMLGWQPQVPNLKHMIVHAWNWHQKRHSQKQVLVTTQFKQASLT